MFESREELLVRIERLEAAILALAESVTAEPSTQIDHEAAVRQVLAGKFWGGPQGAPK